MGEISSNLFRPSAQTTMKESPKSSEQRKDRARTFFDLFETLTMFAGEQLEASCHKRGQRVVTKGDIY